MGLHVAYSNLDIKCVWAYLITINYFDLEDFALYLITGDGLCKLQRRPVLCYVYDLDHKMMDHMSMHFQVISQCSFAVVSFPSYPGHVHGSSMQHVCFVRKK